VRGGEMSEKLQFYGLGVGKVAKLKYRPTTGEQ